jgi:ABC-type branched-subunit amino acid transport system ATPase component
MSGGTSRPGLEVEDIRIQYGGSVAVDSATFAAPMGRLTGLIGPNGAGKTSLFNVCSGLVRPTRGTVHLFGDDVTRVSPARRARSGLGRTFQTLEICNAMTVRENIAVGAEARIAGASVLRQLRLGRTHRTAVSKRIDDAIEICRLGPMLNTRTATLSTGQRRMLELARVLAGGFELLMLDEPSSGLDDEETTEFGRLLQAVLVERDLGVLLVEHDMSLVMSICDHIYVLDFGHMIFDGTPAQTAANPDVQAAYLGEDIPQLEGSA